MPNRSDVAPAVSDADPVELTLGQRVTAVLDAFMRVFRWFTGATLILSCLLLTALLVLAVNDVAHRNWGSVPRVDGTIEYVTTGMVIMVFFALARSEQHDKHVRTPLLTSRIPAQVAAILRGVGLLICALTIAWLAYATGMRAQSSYEVGEVAAGAPDVRVWPARIAISIGAAMLCVELAYRGLVSLLNFRRATHSDLVDAMAEGNVL